MITIQQKIMIVWSLITIFSSTTNILFRRPPPPCTPPTTPSIAMMSLSSEDLASASTPVTPKPMEGAAGHRLLGAGDSHHHHQSVEAAAGCSGVNKLHTQQRVENPATTCVQCHPRPTAVSCHFTITPSEIPVFRFKAEFRFLAIKKYFPVFLTISHSVLSPQKSVFLVFLNFKKIIQVF